MRQFLLMCLCLGLFCTCSRVPSQNNSFGEEIPLKHTVRNPEIYAMRPEGFFHLDSVLVVVSPQIFQPGFGRLISLNTFQEVGKFGAKGKGPTEVIYAFPFAYAGNDSSFMAYDLPSRSVITYTLQQQGDSLTMRAHDKRRVDQGDVPLQDNTKLCRIGDSHYMGQCFHAQDQFFSLIDNDLNQIGHFGNSPIPEAVSNAQDRLQGWMADGYGIAAFIPFDLPYIGCYGMKDGQPVKLWEDDFSEKIYRANNGVLSYDFDRAWGVTRDVKIGKKHIYILWYDDFLSKYHERPTEKPDEPGGWIVFVYDHSGNKVARLRLDSQLCFIEPSDDERTLYGLTTPDYALVTFELPESYPAR